jgi:hypothetical protein
VSFVSIALLTACSTTPLVTKERSTMTPAEIEAAGLECRKNVAIDTNIPRTICASAKSWARYDARARGATDELLAKGREQPNTGRFNRN